jgi:Mrp family chromosome partitioning ATPase
LVGEWRSQYDFVLVDSAPVLPVPDAASLARFCDRTLLVVRYESTMMRAAERSYRLIQKNLPEDAALDVVMNGVPQNSADFFAYYGYKGSAYERSARGHV